MDHINDPYVVQTDGGRHGILNRVSAAMDSRVDVSTNQILGWELIC